MLTLISNYNSIQGTLLLSLEQKSDNFLKFETLSYDGALPDRVRDREILEGNLRGLLTVAEPGQSAVCSLVLAWGGRCWEGLGWGVLGEEGKLMRRGGEG